MNAGNAVSLLEINKSAFKYFECKKMHSSSPTPEKDPDHMFLLSLAPDMKDMTKNQKRRFKIGVLNLVNNILKDKTLTPSPQLSTMSRCSTPVDLQLEQSQFMSYPVQNTSQIVMENSCTQPINNY